MTDRPLTARQAQILDRIAAVQRATGRAPSVRELRDHLGLRGTTAIRGHLLALERTGVIAREPYRARDIFIVRPYAVDLGGHVTPGEVRPVGAGAEQGRRT